MMLLNSALGTAAAILIIASGTIANAQEVPTDVIAAAVRTQGHDCNEPVTAERDAERSGPGMQAWILHCDGGDFRVKFMGDTGAEVEPVS